VHEVSVIFHHVLVSKYKKMCIISQLKVNALERLSIKKETKSLAFFTFFRNPSTPILMAAMVAGSGKGSVGRARAVK
jgi:hypothetical protein